MNERAGACAAAHAPFEPGRAGMLPISAGILAGGQSVRMGRDKTRLTYGGQTFVEHLAEALGGFDEILLSVRRAADWPAAPWPLAEDELAEFGPVEGIYQLLRRARNPHVLVVAVDLQRLNGAFLQAFAAELEPEDRCLVLRSGGLLEPLCSIYHRDALPWLEQMRRAGNRRPRALFDAVPTRYVDVENLGWDPNVVANINTEQDYEALLREK